MLPAWKTMLTIQQKHRLSAEEFGQQYGDKPCERMHGAAAPSG